MAGSGRLPLLAEHPPRPQAGEVLADRGRPYDHWFGIRQGRLPWNEATGMNTVVSMDLEAAGRG